MQPHRALIDAARDAMREKRWHEAAEHWEAVRQADPERAIAWIRGAKALQEAGEIDKAEALLLQARTTFPDKAKIFVQLAEIAEQKGDGEKAFQRWEEVRKRFPNGVAEDRSDDDNARDEIQAGHTAATAAIGIPHRRSLKHLADLVWVKAMFNLKAEASQNKISYLWWILEPLMYMTVFYIVFEKLLHRGGEDYLFYLMVGLVMFQWFAKSVQGASGAIQRAKKVLQQVRITPLFFPAVVIVQTGMKQTAVFILLFAFLWGFGFTPSWQWLGLIPVFLAQFLLIASVGFFLSLLVPLFKDLQQIIPSAIQFLLFVSGIFYSVDRIPEAWRTLFFWNPVANLLYQYRRILLSGAWPDWLLLAQVFVVAAGFALMTFGVYYKFRYHYAKAVME